MYHYYSPPKNTPGWREVLIEASVAVLVFAIIAAASRLFCWSFFIPFHGRYAVGTTLAVLAARWLVPHNRK